MFLFEVRLDSKFKYAVSLRHTCTTSVLLYYVSAVMSVIVAFYEEVGVKEVLGDLHTSCEQCEFLITKTRSDASSNS